MSIGYVVVSTIYRAMIEPAFVDSPFAPWRDPPDRTCIDRVCIRHESCARREAFCTFEGWFDRVARSTP